MAGKYWRNLSEYNNPESFREKIENEFPENITEQLNPDEMDGISRRKFLALLAASTAFVASACTDYRDKGEIIPYNKRPEEVRPGEANHYASICTACSNNCGILIKTREGRPVKIDGNPEHPVNKGKICAIGQAAILNLYDPDRIKEPYYKNFETGWNEINQRVLNSLKETVKLNKEISIISNGITSAGLNKIVNELKNKYPGTELYTYDLNNQSTRFNAWKKSYGQEILPVVRIDKAEVVILVEADILGRDGNVLENSILYSNTKNIFKGELPASYYSIESELTLTGMNADYRFRLDAGRTGIFLNTLNEFVYGKTTAAEVIKIFNVSGIKKQGIENLLDELKKNIGKVVLLGGNSLTEDEHILINSINEKLASAEIFDFSCAYNNVDYSVDDKLNSLIEKMKTGKVHTFINLSANPVYHLSGKKFEEALKNVPVKISLSDSINETTDICEIVLPVNHNFESWGDSAARTGFIGFAQPVIAPLFKTKQKEDILLSWLNDSAEIKENYRLYLKDLIQNEFKYKSGVFASFDDVWYNSLRDGFLELENIQLDKTVFSDQSVNIPADDNNLLIKLTSPYFIGDGKFASNGWLQELPHPVSKVAWDNYAALSPALAKKYKVENGDLINISTANGKVTLPVIIQPGNSDKTISVSWGYGREVISESGKNAGVDVSHLLKNLYNHKVKVNKIEPVGDSVLIAFAQEYHAIDDASIKDKHLSRKIVQEGTLKEYQNNPHFLHDKKHELFSISPEHKYDGNKWVMAIDLNKCTGCTICVASCNVENNIPIVGKEQIAKGREMTWMRIDRYYSGTPENPSASIQPMLCQHCDNAPCENVCPVNATNHSPEGLNQMVYNRCVGTRYCANNCPYKVRRFNYYNFRDHFAKGYYENEYTSLVNNPEVTVRSRGVMEKCTFCVQRIMEARADAIRKGISIKDGSLQTACQQACPTSAIVFGNVNDKEAEILKYRKHNLSYHILEQTNVKPNVTYIAKLRNTNEEKA